MKNVLTNKCIFVLLLAVLAAGCSAPTANVQVNNANSNANSPARPAAAVQTEPAGEKVEPDVLVAGLYKVREGESKIIPQDRVFQKKDRALVDKYFTRETGDLIWKDEMSDRDKENDRWGGGRYADPLYNASRTDVTGFKVGAALIEGGQATVPVSFKGFGNKYAFKFLLVMENGRWKIKDIDYGDDNHTLGRWLERTAARDTRIREFHFEGKYNVGDTTCTVRPAGKDFEVTWADKTEPEIFVYVRGPARLHNRILFASDPAKFKEGSFTNIFVFDSEEYKEGEFVVDQDHRMPVRRAE
jgi:hypothetical protein